MSRHIENCRCRSCLFPLRTVTVKLSPKTQHEILHSGQTSADRIAWLERELAEAIEIIDQLLPEDIADGCTCWDLPAGYTGDRSTYKCTTCRSEAFAERHGLNQFSV